MCRRGNSQLVTPYSRGQPPLGRSGNAEGIDSWNQGFGEVHVEGVLLRPDLKRPFRLEVPWTEEVYLIEWSWHLGRKDKDDIGWQGNGLVGDFTVSASASLSG